jgi:hypothetical protein
MQKRDARDSRGRGGASMVKERSGGLNRTSESATAAQNREKREGD